jgi:hypothetical protein
MGTWYTKVTFLPYLTDRYCWYPRAMTARGRVWNDWWLKQLSLRVGQVIIKKKVIRNECTSAYHFSRDAMTMVVLSWKECRLPLDESRCVSTSTLVGVSGASTI